MIGAMVEFVTNKPNIKFWARKLEAMDFSLTGGYALIGKPFFPKEEINSSSRLIRFSCDLEMSDTLAVGINPYDDDSPTKDQSHCFLFQPNHLNSSILSPISTTIEMNTRGIDQYLWITSNDVKAFLTTTIINSANARLQQEKYFFVPQLTPYSVPYPSCFNVNFLAGVTAYAMGKVPFLVSPSPGKRDDIPLKLEFEPAQYQNPNGDGMKFLMESKRLFLEHLESQRLLLFGHSTTSLAINNYGALPVAPKKSANVERMVDHQLSRGNKPANFPSHVDLLKYLESDDGKQESNEIYEKMIKAVLRKARSAAYFSAEGYESLEDFTMKGAEIIGAVSGYILVKFRGESEPFFFIDGLVNHMDLLEEMDDEGLQALEFLLTEQASRFLGASKTMEVLAQIVSGKTRKGNENE